MKQTFFSFLFCLFCCSPAYALVYHYEIQGQIKYSDYYKANGYDPFVNVEDNTFRLFGMWGDLGTKAYTVINGETFVNEHSSELFFPYNSTVTFSGDLLDYHARIANPLGVWRIFGFDTSQKLVSDDGSVNWNMFSDLDWQILWISAIHNDPNLPEYWEYDGTITSASLSVSPVPEPATAFLCGVGIVFFIGWQLRRKKILKNHIKCKILAV